MPTRDTKKPSASPGRTISPAPWNRTNNRIVPIRSYTKCDLVFHLSPFPFFEIRKKTQPSPHGPPSAQGTGMVRELRIGPIQRIAVVVVIQGLLTDRHLACGTSLGDWSNSVS